MLALRSNANKMKWLSDFHILAHFDVSPNINWALVVQSTPTINQQFVFLGSTKSFYLRYIARKQDKQNTGNDFFVKSPPRTIRQSIFGLTFPLCILLQKLRLRSKVRPSHFYGPGARCD